jgi:addiction module HigA family antidote
MGSATQDVTEILNGRRRRPTHPGALLREDILPHVGLSQTALAERLDVTRQTINDIVTEKRGVSLDMAYRLGRLFSMDPATWIRMQEAVDVWDTLKANRKVYEKIIPIS